MNRIIGAIGHFFKVSAVWVSQKFIALFGADEAHAFALAAENLLKSPIGKIAATVVANLVALEIPGTEKAAQALALIATQAKASGIEIASSEINLLIETAVQRIKGSFGPGTTPPATN